MYCLIELEGNLKKQQLKYEHIHSENNDLKDKI